MSHQTRLYGLRALAQQIEAERIKLTGAMPKAGSHGHQQLEAKIAGWERTVQAVARDLKSRSHFAQMVHDKNRFGAGAYQAGQRFKSQQGNISELSRELSDVAAALVDLNRDLWAGPGAEARALEGMKHALGNWVKANQHSEDGVLGKVPTNLETSFKEVIVQAPRGGPAGAPPSMQGPGPIDIFTMILSLFVLAKSLSKNKDA